MHFWNRKHKTTFVGRLHIWIPTLVYILIYFQTNKILERCLLKSGKIMASDMEQFEFQNIAIANLVISLKDSQPFFFFSKGT